MKTTLLIVILCSSLTLNLFAQEVIHLSASDSSYKNLREANSNFISSRKEQEITQLYKGSSSLESLREIISDKSINRCATKIVAAIKDKLGVYSSNETNMAILGLRLDESIDDVTTSILIKAQEIHPSSNTMAKNDLTSEEVKIALGIYKSESQMINDKSLCPEDSYRTLYAKLSEGSYKFSKEIKRINKLALKNGIIKNAKYKDLEAMRVSKVHEWPMTLTNYRANLDAINNAFPNRKKEASKFVTHAGKFRTKVGLRQSLYERFSSTQIILLANVVQSLKKRLESRDITIHINYVEENSEIINLSPMEKFRFILKLLRKELATINNSSMLKGQRANYSDIITAAYEVGYINAEEIEIFASLEDIWNPEKTTKEKIMTWVKLFGGVSSVLLPPPFGFLSVLVIMLIDQQLADAPVDPDSDFNLI